MGRGRQKAKHTKVARELKYFSPNTDLTQLERELAARKAEEDPWAEYADKYNDDLDESGSEEHGSGAHGAGEDADDEDPAQPPA